MAKKIELKKVKSNAARAAFWGFLCSKGEMFWEKQLVFTAGKLKEELESQGFIYEIGELLDLFKETARKLMERNPDLKVTVEAYELEEYLKEYPDAPIPNLDNYQIRLVISLNLLGFSVSSLGLASP